MIRIIYLFFCIFFSGTLGLKLTRLSVPKLIDYRDSAVMTCLFDLENQKLYSVKWYKNDLEFYRFMPNNYPQMQIFQVEGVHLDIQKSNMTTVTLHPLDFTTSGLFACEISTEAPHFKTVQTTSVMTVIGMPKTDPVITGLKSMYSVGEFVHANCTSAESYPIAALRWYINDNQIEPWQLQRYGGNEPGEKEVRPSTLGISFQADYNHFPGKGLTMHLRCVAQVEDVVRQTSYAAKLAELDLDKYAQGLLRNSGSLILCEKYTIAFMVLMRLLLRS